jgi:hypothetical protein
LNVDRAFISYAGVDDLLQCNNIDAAHAKTLRCDNPMKEPVMAQPFFGEMFDQMTTFAEAAQKMQAESMERARTTYDELLKLNHAQVDYMLTLQREWQSMGMDLLKRMGEQAKAA